MSVRTWMTVLLGVPALTPSWSGKQRLALPGRNTVIVATRISLDPADPARRRVGRLTFMGGVALASSDPAFGGFSAINVRGDRVTLLSDGGNVAAFTLRPDGTASDASFAALPAGPGTGWEKRDRDSEAMAMHPLTGQVWVGFERANAIWRYDAGFARATATARPAAMRRWWQNGGAETLVRRRDGSFIAIEEDGRGPTREALVWTGDPTWRPTPAFRFRYRPPPGFLPTDAAELPDGRLMVLNRSWTLPLRFASVLVAIDPRAIRPGATVAGTPIARLAAPLVHGNFEGVAATVERGRTMVWLVSDNDGRWRARTLLLKFRLE